jgi:hypothetical protein
MGIGDGEKNPDRLGVFIKGLLDERNADAKKVILVMDNLNTHGIASLYEVFPPEEALGYPLASISTSPPSTEAGSTWQKLN